MLKLYLDAVEHQDKKIMEACSQIITERFEEVINREAPDLTHMLELDIDNMITILRSDNLNLINEDCLVELIRKYISVRDDIKPLQIESAEQQTKPELWALLTEEEKLNRTTAF